MVISLFDQPTSVGYLFVCVLVVNLLFLGILVSIALTLVTSISYTVFLTTLSNTLHSLIKSVGTVFSLSLSILSAWAFNLAKSDFAARLDVSTAVALFNQLLLHN